MAVAAAVVAAAFAWAIRGLASPGVGLHELAGLLLLVATGLLLVLTWRAAPELRRLLPLVVAAFATLVVMGGTGAALATGALPASYDPLPLGILVVYIALCLGIAVRAARVGRAASSEPRSGVGAA